VAQLQGESFLEDQLVDALSELDAQEGLAEGDAALGAGNGGSQEAFDDDQLDNTAGVDTSRADR
jgi:hypothetical protein